MDERVLEGEPIPDRSTENPNVSDPNAPTRGNPMSLSNIMKTSSSQPLSVSSSNAPSIQYMTLEDLYKWLEVDLTRYEKATYDLARVDDFRLEMLLEKLRQATWKSKIFQDHLRRRTSDVTAWKFPDLGESTGSKTVALAVRLHPLFHIPDPHINLYFHHETLTKFANSSSQKGLSTQSNSRPNANSLAQDEHETWPLFRAVIAQLIKEGKGHFVSGSRISTSQGKSLPAFENILQQLLRLFAKPVTIFLITSCLSKIDADERRALVDLTKEMSQSAYEGKVYFKVLLVEAYDAKFEEYIRENGIGVVEVGRDANL